MCRGGLSILIRGLNNDGSRQSLVITDACN